MLGHPIKHTAHTHGDTRNRQITGKDFSAVRRFEYGLVDILSDLTGINVKGRDNTDIGNSIGSNMVMQDAYTILGGSVGVIMNTLNQGTGTVSESYNGDSNFVSLYISIHSYSPKVRL